MTVLCLVFKKMFLLALKNKRQIMALIYFKMHTCNRQGGHCAKLPNCFSDFGLFVVTAFLLIVCGSPQCMLLIGIHASELFYLDSTFLNQSCHKGVAGGVSFLLFILFYLGVGVLLEVPSSSPVGSQKKEVLNLIWSTKQLSWSRSMQVLQLRKAWFSKIRCDLNKYPDLITSVNSYI